MVQRRFDWHVARAHSFALAMDCKRVGVLFAPVASLVALAFASGCGIVHRHDDGHVQRHFDFAQYLASVQHAGFARFCVARSALAFRRPDLDFDRVALCRALEVDAQHVDAVRARAVQNIGVASIWQSASQGG